MNLPNKVTEPRWISHSKIQYVPSKFSVRSFKYVKLPKWLMKLIDERVNRAYIKGREELQKELNKLLTK